MTNDYRISSDCWAAQGHTTDTTHVVINDPAVEHDYPRRGNAADDPLVDFTPRTTEWIAQQHATIGANPGCPAGLLPDSCHAAKCTPDVHGCQVVDAVARAHQAVTGLPAHDSSVEAMGLARWLANEQSAHDVDDRAAHDAEVSDSTDAAGS